ncbi:hypothetical protein GGI07_002914 [Coemansia sp. Benny D115]|nr:hypothetical protein GGI07_002914 [Coemansia sp. Benny D115]
MQPRVYQLAPSEQSSPMEEASGAVVPTTPACRRSQRQPRQRYLDNALTGNEVFELLDDYITETGRRTPRKKRRVTATTKTTERPTGQPKQPLRPRWYNQMYLMFLALRQSPGYTASRSDLVRMAVELDQKISKDRGLPKAFTGKTPLNSASALLTNNGDKYFVQFRPEGAKCYHFRLAYAPGDFEAARAAYVSWVNVLVEKDWPLCFGPPEQESKQVNGGGGGGEKVIENENSRDESVDLAELTDSALVLEKPIIASAEKAADVSTNVSTDVSADVPADSVSTADPAAPANTKTSTNSISETDANASANTGADSVAGPALPIPRSWRDIVEVRPSTIPGAGNGLFAVRELPAGIPLGFYFGVPMTEDEFDSLKEPVGMASHYSIMYRRTVLDATDDKGMPYTDPDGPLYCPFHFMNEDRQGENFNIAFLEGVKVNQVICMTTKVINAGDELFVSYGDEVDRSHWDSSRGSSVPEKSDTASRPMRVLETLASTNAQDTEDAAGTEHKDGFEQLNSLNES